jgi:hypothetical protein
LTSEAVRCHDAPAPARCSDDAGHTFLHCGRESLTEMRMLPSLPGILHVLPHELMLMFLAGLVTGVLLVEGIIEPRRERRALISRRLRG